MKKVKNNIFVNIFTSGKDFTASDESSLELKVRYILLNFLIFLGGSLLFLFGFENLYQHNLLLAVVDLLMGSLTVIAFIILRTKAPFMVSSLMTVVPFGILCAIFAQSGGAQGSGIMWSFSFPMMAVFLLGMGPGLILSSLLFVCILLALFLPGFSPMLFDTSFAFRSIGVYILILAITIVYELTKISKERRVFSLNRTLAEERDEIAAMKDNLKVGLFLMDKDLIIQAQYSKALESILDKTNLQETNFLNCLKNSLSDKELSTTQDYFEMVFNKSFDAQMLEDINPLQQVVYVSNNSKKDKILRCAFSTITRENGQIFILGFIEDITYEVELQRQLDQEEGKREQEMHALFEVIHVEPRVLDDFIEDVEYEFDRINAVLKDKTKDSSQIMVDLYQSVHAIKSNAVILGLDSFAQKVHALEDSIRELREASSISFDQILHITLEIEKIMKLKDGFRDIIQKISNFTQSDSRINENEVFKQTLEKTVKKASTELGKKVHFVITKLDDGALELGPRRIMKEILMQLVRNAVYHGIESPELREISGKNSTGSIKLTIMLQKNTVIMDLSDDGKGLDFASISEKAEQKGLITDKIMLKDKSALVQVLFSAGFSTNTSADMYAGRGVGLNLVKERIAELKGSINLKSEEGKGTNFRVVLPLAVQAQRGITA